MLSRALEQHRLLHLLAPHHSRPWMGVTEMTRLDDQELGEAIQRSEGEDSIAIIVPNKACSPWCEGDNDAHQGAREGGCSRRRHGRGAGQGGAGGRGRARARRGRVRRGHRRLQRAGAAHCPLDLYVGSRVRV